MNVLEIDLNCPAISFFVTPGGPEYDDPKTEVQEEVLAQRTTTFMANYGLQLGINGDFAASAPGPRYEYQPRVVLGLAVSNGVQYSTDDGRPALTLPRNAWSGTAYIGRAPFPADVHNAIGANKMLVENGQPVDPLAWDPIGGALNQNPRTASGLSADGRKLIIVVIDGRQAGFSEGVTLPEMAEYLIEFGAYTGLNHDGGGSSTMVSTDEFGPTIINYPSDAGGERIVSNHLGIFSTPAELYVDNEAPNDPGPNMWAISDPDEDGSPEHPFDTVQEAIDASCDGTTVIVRPGRYFENINVRAKNITVTSSEPGEPYVVSDTVIDGNDLGPVVTFEGGAGPGGTLSGFVLTRGKGTEAGAVCCHSSNSTISNCLIVGNRVLGDSGGVVACRNSNCVLDNCTISDNLADAHGSAIYCFNSNVALRNSIVWKNWPDEIHVESGSAPEVAYCIVFDGRPGADNHTVDPCFAEPGHWADANNPDLVVAPNVPDAVWIAGDYHIESQGGRWVPSIQEWVFDNATSWAIDAGDPNSMWTREPWPHGRRVNIGAFGGTSEASMSLSNVGNVVDLPAEAPAVPTNLVATPSDSQILLDWGDNTETDLAGYNVYRSLRPDSDYSRISQSLLPDSEYMDAGVADGMTYYYVVAAEDMFGNESAYSDEVSARAGIQPVMKLLAGFGVKTIGTAISKWADQAKHNDAEQQTVEDQPELVLSAINGEPAIEFDGTGEHLDVANSADINTGSGYSAKTLAVVFKTGSNITSRQVIWEQGGDTRGLNFYLDSGDLYVNGWNLQEIPWLATTPSIPVSVDTTYVATLVMDAVAGRFEGYVNGSSIGHVDNIAWLYGHSGACALGHVEGRTRLHDGSTAGPASFNGQIAEFHHYNEVLSNSNRQTLEHTLMSKYGN